jgi:c(7)-type cytochrome triheme protein
MRTLLGIFRKLAAGALALSAPLAVAAGDGPAGFPHRIHLESGAECGDCHADSTSPGGVPTISPDACAKCHDDGREAHASAAIGGKPAKAVAFPHRTHAKALDCKECHGQIASGSDAPPGAAETGRMDWKRCRGCHEENGVEVPAGKCVACHGVDMRHAKPADHAVAGWPSKHGREAGWRDIEQHGEACGQCHKRSSCKACHQVARPASHSGLWRVRTHGIEAGWDRSSCKTCHETPACVRCHKQTRPVNHTGGWSKLHGLSARTRDNSHCSTCHSLSYCAACHSRK